MTKFLIINADDFGLSPGINRGVIEVFVSGNLTSTSMFANLPGFDDAVTLVSEHGSLGVGLHFNLTYGRPVLPSSRVPSLVDSSGDFRYRSLDWRNPGWEENEVGVELEAQWQKLVKAGLRPTHIDSHHYIQNYPVVYRPVIQLARRQGLPIRRTRRPMVPEYLFMTDTLVAAEYSGANGLSCLIDNLKSLQEGVTELNCHPGHSDSIAAAISDWTAERDSEWSVFTNPAVSRLLSTLELKKIHYGQLSEARAHP